MPFWQSYSHYPPKDVKYVTINIKQFNSIERMSASFTLGLSREPASYFTFLCMVCQTWADGICMNMGGLSPFLITSHLYLTNITSWNKTPCWKYWQRPRCVSPLSVGHSQPRRDLQSKTLSNVLCCYFQDVRWRQSLSGWFSMQEFIQSNYHGGALMLVNLPYHRCSIESNFNIHSNRFIHIDNTPITAVDSTSIELVFHLRVTSKVTLLFGKQLLLEGKCW